MTGYGRWPLAADAQDGLFHSLCSLMLHCVFFAACCCCAVCCSINEYIYDVFPVCASSLFEGNHTYRLLHSPARRAFLPLLLIRRLRFHCNSTKLFGKVDSLVRRSVEALLGKLFFMRVLGNAYCSAFQIWQSSI